MTPDPTSTAWSSEEATRKLLRPIVQKKMKKLLGVEGYSPSKLIALYRSNVKGEAIADNDVLDLLEMFRFYVENTLHFTFGLDLLDHYLMGGGTPLALSSTLLTSQVDFEADVRDRLGTPLRSGIEARVFDASGGNHPSETAVLRDEGGNSFVVSPAPSVLRAGGTEKLYVERSARVSRAEKSERGVVFGEVAVICELTVTTTVTAPGEWQVVVDGARCWARDKGDFDQKTQDLPIDVMREVPGPLRETVRGILESQGILSGFYEDGITIQDQYLRQLHGKTIEKESVVTKQSVTYRVNEYDILFDAWDYTDKFRAWIPTVLREPETKP